ncbi:hypothetical protein Pst134EA_032291 [Puccinia striiformis f. sp. tritici]|uniref:uncharacterized protein n=1 Tax=Puccinia striiformis f. sp. tritici TaxID=168172 RepID=UPI002008101D|nr:uncharacterized protein Pst134EA_032291 [Puccinia striiformis f. sp. tritici]KAH9441801.1 hypothetical protein Pst134EA_032291 [Puccinia striiformis f. sp. tritici]
MTVIIVQSRLELQTGLQSNVSFSEGYQPNHRTFGQYDGFPSSRVAFNIRPGRSPTNPSRPWIITQSLRKHPPRHPTRLLIENIEGNQRPFTLRIHSLRSNLFAFANQKPALIETPSSSSKSVINHESIKPTASLPDSSKPAPSTFGTKKPIVPEIPPAACKFGIKHEELNIESKASYPEYSQSASSASAPNKTTASESTCPEDRIATLDGFTLPSASPAFSAFSLTKESQSTFTTKDNKPNEPKPTALTRRSNRKHLNLISWCGLSIRMPGT